MKIKRLLSVTTMVAIMAAVAACGGKDDKAKDGAAGKAADGKDALAASVAKPEAKPVVSVEAVAAENVAQLEELTATVKPFAKNDIVSQSAGRIVKINCEVGDFVTKGQLLVKMDETNLLTLRTQIANAEVDYKRTKALLDAGGASQQQVDSYKMQLDVYKENLNNLLENVNLKAPISGVITARNYENGDMYKGGEPIVTINQMQPVKIIVNASEGNFNKIRKGQKVDLVVDALNGFTTKGTVGIIYPIIDEATRTFQVEINIPNAGNKVRPGMFARATFNLGVEKNVLIPDVAVQKQMGSGDHFVYLYENGKVRYSKVSLGRRLGDKYEVKSGVPDKSQVVISGASKLTDGAQVEVVAKKQ